MRCPWQLTQQVLANTNVLLLIGLQEIRVITPDTQRHELPMQLRRGEGMKGILAVDELSFSPFPLEVTRGNLQSSWLGGTWGWGVAMWAGGGILGLSRGGPQGRTFWRGSARDDVSSRFWSSLPASYLHFGARGQLGQVPRCPQGSSAPQL